MNIPSHWAEARIVGEVQGRSRVVRRYGWSDTSDAEAREHAHERASRALAELQAGTRVATRERKLAYGGDGMPIREEVIARNDQDVVTRNRYGARCLNEPDVWFADVDHDPRLPPAVEALFAWLGWASGLGALAIAIALFWQRQPGPGIGALVCVALLPVTLMILRVHLRWRPRNQQAHRVRIRRRIVEFVEARPESRLAVYETPAGTRLLALHRTFDASSDIVQQMFREVDADPAYARLCRLQSCFRTRVSAKPWRIGVPTIVTRAVWPVPLERMEERTAWVGEYETAAHNYAACRFVEELGIGRVDPRCAEIQRLHDELCRARSALPIA